jgi:hypothetical protein
MSKKTGRLAVSATMLLTAAACGTDPAAAPAAAPASVPPSAAVASPAASAAALPMPEKIPGAAFLQATDVPGRAKAEPERLGAGDQPLPEFCDEDYLNEDRVGVRATQALAFTGPSDPSEATPRAMTYEDVLVFRDDGAERFLADLRGAVESCPGADGRKHRLAGPVDAGDDAVLIEQSGPAYGDDGEPTGDGSQHYVYWAAVRVRDAVAFVSNTGWESGSADRADTVHLARKAADRLAAWRR